jgi:thioester reductase-like protein
LSVIVEEKLAIKLNPNFIYEKPLFNEFVNGIKKTTELNNEKLMKSYITDINNYQTFKNEKIIKTSKIRERAYLITGCTGIVGLNLIIRLINLNTAFKIICLVRNKDGKSGEERLLKKIKQHSEFHNTNQIITIDSDLKNIGNSNIKLYITKFDIISAFLCAADMRHFVDYNSSRKVNVINQITLIKLLYKYHIKINVFSSLAIFGFTGKSFSEITDLKTVEPNLVYGYGSSKLALELIINKSIEKQYPINVFRIGAIIFDSVKNDISEQWLFIYSYLSNKMNLLCDEMDNVIIPYCELDWLIDNIYNISNNKKTFDIFHLHYSEQKSVNKIILTKKNINKKINLIEWSKKAILFSEKDKSINISSVYATINIINELNTLVPLPNYNNKITINKLKLYE